MKTSLPNLLQMPASLSCRRRPLSMSITWEYAKSWVPAFINQRLCRYVYNSYSCYNLSVLCAAGAGNVCFHYLLAFFESYFVLFCSVYFDFGIDLFVWCFEIFYLFTCFINWLSYILLFCWLSYFFNSNPLCLYIYLINCYWCHFILFYFILLDAQSYVISFTGNGLPANSWRICHF